ncbi:MAG: homoserine dehydrogenase, partial [Nitrospirota bacterium]|nr:homoserine dehydrogenase [Nitrospirota bacterium]
AKILLNNADVIRRRLGANLVLKRVADHHVDRLREGLDLSGVALSTDAADVINDPSIDIVVELIGGYGVAKQIILDSLSAGKHVVTANKALLALHGEEIYQKAAETGREVGFEASVGGGIPIIKAIREGLAANHIKSIYGIINGTCNFILTKMTNEGSDFAETLKEAQALGYAEADPTFDVEGIDTAHKLAVLINIAFGTPVPFDAIYTEGITKLAPTDFEYAKDFGYKIKLLAIAKDDKDGIEARVHPTLVPNEYHISTVDGVFNAVAVEGDAVGQTLFYGRGAGEMPTGSAVVADIIDIARDIVYKSEGMVPVAAFRSEERKQRTIKPMDAVETCYYLRFTVLDKPGVLASIAGVLGNHQISISSVSQKGRAAGEAVSIVITTHKAVEKNLRSALEEIDLMPAIVGKTVIIRVEGEE